jgi:hypothetical protein
MKIRPEVAMAKMTNAEASAAILNPLVIAELKRESPGFDRGALLTAIVEAWGGYDRFARDVATEFETAARGSMVRQRTLEMVVRLIDRETERASSITPPEKMTDEDLRRSLLAALGTATEPIADDADPEP